MCEEEAEGGESRVEFFEFFCFRYIRVFFYRFRTMVFVNYLLIH